MPVKNVIPGQKITRAKLERAREFRREMTPWEAILWQELRGNKLGAHFRRQQIIAGFIVDFYCHKAGLVIELDGSVHQENEQKQHDADRDGTLSEMGLRVIRFKNDDIEKNLEDVLVKIRKSLKTSDNKNFGG